MIVFWKAQSNFLPPPPRLGLFEHKCMQFAPMQILWGAIIEKMTYIECITSLSIYQSLGRIYYLFGKKKRFRKRIPTSLSRVSIYQSQQFTPDTPLPDTLLVFFNLKNFHMDSLWISPLKKTSPDTPPSFSQNWWEGVGYLEWIVVI